ncbi:MAG: hypothetical protein O7G88_20170 [bacterium]|nr:hypothetical protein [bacterium]
MHPEYAKNIKHRPDGSIDTAYYMRIGHQKRSEQAHELMELVSRNLSPARLHFSGKYILSIFSSPGRKLQDV